MSIVVLTTEEETLCFSYPDKQQAQAEVDEVNQFAKQYAVNVKATLLPDPLERHTGLIDYVDESGKYGDVLESAGWSREAGLWSKGEHQDLTLPEALKKEPDIGEM